MTPVPALPAATGPDPRRARFFMELSSGMEFLALWWSLSAEDQTTLREQISGFAARAAEAQKRGER